MGDVLAELIQGIYNVGYSIWNYLIDIAVSLFVTSPTAANGSVYATTHTLFLAISSISLPISVVFFLLAIIKDVMSTPSEQQLSQLMNDSMKFGVMVGILANLWAIMGYVMQIADGITADLAISANYDLALSSDLINIIIEATTLPTFDFTHIGESIGDIIGFIFTVLLFFLTSLATLVIIIASAISIISCGFQRILKPLVIMPFASVTVAMATGSGEASRVTSQYIKTFFGLCLSGAFMVIYVNLGVALSNGLIVFDYASLTTFEKVLFISVQNAITPIIISGLVKSADTIIGKFL